MMETPAFTTLPRSEPGTLTTTLVIVLAGPSPRFHHQAAESGYLPTAEALEDEPTWKDAEWR